ncbi:MAG TPA: AAA family ATPase, partial [Symbiobacteriaceae bacterium]|nr:AAA family ATPase [Symbiobacteriaceae bacterium]
MMPVVATKLFAPIPHPAAVRRTRLLQRLDAGLEGAARLLLVEAPAGYGKSTLLAAWLAAAGRPYSWLSLDQGDDDLARFTWGLVAALRQVAGDGVGQAVESLLSMPQAPAPDAVAGSLVNDLLRLEHPVIVVLDDYHVIRSPEVHRVIQVLLERRPPALHLVIATRADPLLPVARWRARGEVAEIRADELRFTTEEAGEFLRRTMNLTVPDEAVAALGARTEGWAAGLQLAGLSLKGRDADGVRSFVTSFSGSHRYVIDYLADEVLRELSSNLRDFMRQTAVLERLSADLCDAVTGWSDSRTHLAALERANLFLIPLDDGREWYRYHHLFQDVLRSELSRAERVTLHGRAAVWYESEG